MSVTTASTVTTAYDVALLHTTFQRVWSGDTHVPGCGTGLGIAAPFELDSSDIAECGATVAEDLEITVCPEDSSEFVLGRPVSESEFTVSVLAAAFDPWWAETHAGYAQQLAVASRDDFGPRTFWWSVDGVSFYEA